MHSIVGSYLKPPERVCVPSITQSDEKFKKKQKNSVRLFFEAPKSLQMVTAAMKLKGTYSLEGKL